MVFIAGTTFPDRITVRHIAMILTVLMLLTHNDDIYRLFMLAIFVQMYTKLAYYVPEHWNNLVNTDCRTLYYNTIEVIEHTIEERNTSIID